MADDPRELFVQHYKRIVLYLIRRFRFSEEEARDIAQDTFASVFEYMKRHRIDAPWAFLKMSAHNIAVNVIRKRVLRRLIEPKSIDELPHLSETFLRDFFSGEPPATPQDDAVVNEQSARLRDEIEKLHDTFRECLLLRLNGMHYEEIAAALHISVDAVKSRLRDAKKVLRERLGVNTGAEGDDDWKK
jgi:RNA polymerase sigma factor (sigma-70 family)